MTRSRPEDTLREAFAQYSTRVLAYALRHVDPTTAQILDEGSSGANTTFVSTVVSADTVEEVPAKVLQRAELTR